MKYLKGSRVKRKVVDCREWMLDPADSEGVREYMKRQMLARKKADRLLMMLAKKN